MTNLNTVTQILDATTGDSDEFKSVDNILTYKFTISGTPNANIEVYVNNQLPNAPMYYVRAKCTDWNGASIILKAKTAHVSDSFSETGVDGIISQNTTIPFEYK